MILYNVFFSFLILMFASNLAAQDIEARLSGATNAQGFTVQDNASNSLFTVRGDGKAGLGTGSPVFKLTLEKDGGILAKGTEGAGATLPSMTGPVMIWYPRKSAFRAGYAYLGNWNDAKIGKYSFAAGSVPTASGTASIALGNYTIASGGTSTALGFKTNASGGVSTAFGYQTVATGTYSSALGRETTAGGESSTAMGHKTKSNGFASTAMGYETSATSDASIATGYKTTASGKYSTAMGFISNASGHASTAIGYENNATGDYAIVMGYKSYASGKQSVSIGSYVSTNGITGSMILGDASTTTLRKAFKENKFYAFFDGGYHLFTNGTGTSYVYLNHNDNAWKTSS
ncbi:MAG: hypothetical protein GXO82_00820, partial [Chlorobi bacterium]|nr:hypothetical protein [Chlorobiota bacterium]